MIYYGKQNINNAVIAAQWKVFNEDVVFSWLGLLNPHDLRIADVNTALRFAFGN